MFKHVKIGLNLNIYIFRQDRNSSCKKGNYWSLINEKTCLDRKLDDAR